MDESTLHLKILLPHGMLLDCPRVRRLVVETSHGSLGLLPRRLDSAASLVPGILCYEARDDGERYVALGEGVMVKTGPLVRIAVRQAIVGGDLGHLRAALESELCSRAEREQGMRTVLAKLEAGFARRFLEVQRG